MEHERPHRSISTVEVGVADAAAPHAGKHAVVHAAPPAWLLRYEDARPRELQECLAEAVGAFIYVYLGIGATLAFNITSLAKLVGDGSLFAVAVSYGLGIVLAIVVSGPVSGSHLSPGYTIAFALFKGFPWRKVPQYIIAQIIGAFCAALLCYVQYGQQSREVTTGFAAFGAQAENFTPAGIAGALAIFPTPGQSLGLVFLNELVCTTLLAVVVFAVLDSTNLFIAFSSAPFVIGAAYLAIISSFAVDTVVLNTARDLGGRFACGVVYGTQCFPAQFSALAALTNILGSILGGGIQVLLLSDHRRPHINLPPGHSVASGEGSSDSDLRSDEPYGEKGMNGHHARGVKDGTVVQHTVGGANIGNGATSHI